MKAYRRGSHSVFQLHIHLVWCTKYRKRVLRKDVGLRLRELSRQICSDMEEKGHHLAGLEQEKDLSVIAAQPRPAVAVKFSVQANCASSDFVREGYGTTDPHLSPLWIKTLGLPLVGAGTRPLAHSSPRISSVPISCPSAARERLVLRQSSPVFTD